MIFTTKFDLGDIIYIFMGSDIKEYEIIGIDIYSKAVSTMYYQLKSTSVNNTQTVREHEIFTSKEEAGIAWLKAQGLSCGLKDVQ